MEILLDPNIAYMLLVIGMLFALVAILMPGTGIPEILAVFSIVLAGYAVYHLSFNWWALAILILSVVPFFLAVRGPGRALWLVLSILGLTIGSVFFFPTEAGLVSVNPTLAVVTTVLYSVFLWVAVRKVVEVARTRPMHELSALIGQRGEAKTSITEGGTVQVAGELWSARSQAPVGAGNSVKVIGRDGFVLLVEKDRD
jgi:membrane-bound serine protease (ClpP class)